MSEGRIKADTLGKKPEWLRKRLSIGSAKAVEHTIEKGCLHTVCSEAACPNRNECYSKGTAAFMILGNICTRNCSFCNVISRLPDPPDLHEPERVAEAVRSMGLSYCVITSVTRDDLEDGGSGLFGDTILAVRKNCECRIEVLTPDFQGKKEDIEKVIQSGPDVYNHNLETVKRVYPAVRPQAVYKRSLDVLRYAADTGITTKSGIMTGVGETDDEIFELFEDLRRIGCNLLTIGQYLQPNSECLPVYEYVTPEHFEYLGSKAKEMGFDGVSSGPFVRSSHNAGDLFMQVKTGHES